MAGKYNYPYKKGVDLTAWILQVLACLVLIAISAFVIVNYNSRLLKYVDIAGVTVFVALSVVTIVIDIIEVVLITRKNMPVELYLTLACLKTLLWLIICILEGMGWSVLGVIISVVLTATSVAQLIQGAYIVDRKRHGQLNNGTYSPTRNFAATEDIETSYTPQFGVATYDTPANKPFPQSNQVAV